MRDSIRRQYERHSARGYYSEFGEAYQNPHEPEVSWLLRNALTTWSFNLSRVLDLACGSGEATRALLKFDPTVRIEGADPYTGKAYRQATGQQVWPLSFEQIAAGALREKAYSLIVCSFALHLLEPSRLPQLLLELSAIAPDLLVLTPHKRPHIEEAWGWRLQEEIMHCRVRLRWYQNCQLSPVATNT